MAAWWETFFDADYLRIWEGWEAPDKTEREAAGLWAVLGLQAGHRVLDAPCGYGRIARALAARGARVVGVDLSDDLLAEAERRRGALAPEGLRFRRHDLRAPLDEGGFDCALNIYSSLGYGSETDDLAILRNLREAVRPGGLVFVETNHRDSVVLGLSRNPRPGHRLPDGTLLVEEPRFDQVIGRIETTWSWSGPSGAGQKSASFRMYAATELVRLLERAGLTFRSAHSGCSAEPFPSDGPPSGARLGLLAVRE
jgi:SAM-dependent methyltransferase